MSTKIQYYYKGHFGWTLGPGERIWIENVNLIKIVNLTVKNWTSYLFDKSIKNNYNCLLNNYIILLYNKSIFIYYYFHGRLLPIYFNFKKILNSLHKKIGIKQIRSLIFSFSIYIYIYIVFSFYSVSREKV